MGKNKHLDIDEERAERAQFGGLLKTECEDIQNAITRQKKKSAELSGDLSGKFDLFEKAGGRKDVAKIVNNLLNMDPTDRADWKRQLDGQCAAMGVFDQQDMIDQLEEQKKNAAVSNTVKDDAKASEAVAKAPPKTQADIMAAAH